MGQKQSVPAAAELSSGTSTNEVTGKLASATQQQNIAAEIERRSNPPEADAANHNFGQPIRPPHKSSTSTINNEKSGASKLVTDCRVQQRASLACIEENYQNKNEACAKYFEEYKKCRRQEHERKLEANARASGLIE